MRIYKEAVSVFDTWVTVSGFRIVSVGVRGENLYIWYTTGDEEPGMKFQYKVVGTGWEFDGDCIVVGSVIDDPYVWHVLERHWPD